MKVIRSSNHSVYLRMMFVAASLVPITTEVVEELSVSCQNRTSTYSKEDDSFEGQESYLTATAAPVPHSIDYIKVVPAGSTDMIAIARQVLWEKEAAAFCKSRQSTLVDTQGVKKCKSVTATKNTTHVCYKKTIIVISVKRHDALVNKNKERGIYITGNTFSFIFLLALLATYIHFKDLQTSYGKCVVILSIVVIVKDILQLIAYQSNRKNTPFCKVIGASSHWSHLSMFGWMASIAFDLLTTFSRIRIPSPLEQHQRMKRYVAFSFAVPSVIVLLCVVIDLCHTELYGVNGVCFVSQKTANSVSFTVPAVTVLIFNVVCMVSTIYYIRSASKASQRLWKNDERKPSIGFIVMTVKFSLLLGLGWVAGYIGCLSYNTILLYTFLFMDSFQGVFIYVAFCGNQRVFRFYKRTLNNRVRRIESASSKRPTKEIDL